MNKASEKSDQKQLSEQSIEALKAELEVLRDAYDAIRSEIPNDENKIVSNTTSL